MTDTRAMPPAEPQPARIALSRRRLLGAGAVAAAATAVSACGSSSGSTGGSSPARRTSAPTPTTIPFYGARQAGITTAQQDHLRFAAFDLRTEDLGDLRDLLSAWTVIAADLCSGARAARAGEAMELLPGRLTITFGFGPSLFEHEGHDRFGLAAKRPAALEQIPAFGADAFDRRRCGGDLGVQICSDDAQVAFHAFHTLMNVARGVAEPRWLQAGFLGERPAGETNRNLLGFKDGTRNLDARDEQVAGTQLWTAAGDGAPWMAGGSYLVARRVRTVLDVWDATSVAGQEQTIGRRKASGAPLGGRAEHDVPDFKAEGPNGLTIPADAHIRLASPESNRGAQLLRRGYNYDDGIDASTAQVDAGLFFLCFQRDPRKQFVPIQRRLAANDALAQHVIHTAGAVFACPPGVQPGEVIGQALFA